MGMRSHLREPISFHQVLFKRKLSTDQLDFFAHVLAADINNFKLTKSENGGGTR